MQISFLPVSASPFLILLAFALYGLGHSLMASHRAKELARRWCGSTADRVYRLVFNAGGVITLLPILALVGLLPDHHLYTIPFPWTLLTLAGQGYAIYMLLASLQQTGTAEFLGLQQALADDPSKPPKLVMRGFYRWVRHPLYTASMLFLWLTPMMSINLLALNLAISAYFAVGAKFEERKLARDFGRAYLDYKAHTPMFFPRLKTRPSQD